MSKRETAIAKAARPTPPPAAGTAALRQVVAWIVAGHSEADITEALTAQFPAEKGRPLIVAALKEIAAAGEPDAHLVRGFAIEGTRTIYRKCLEVADHQTALRALRQLVELTKRK
jgi:hypothetical protein